MFAKGRTASDQTLFRGILTAKLVTSVARIASNLKRILPRCVYSIKEMKKSQSKHQFMFQTKPASCFG